MASAYSEDQSAFRQLNYTRPVVRKSFYQTNYVPEEGNHSQMSLGRFKSNLIHGQKGFSPCEPRLTQTFMSDRNTVGSFTAMTADNGVILGNRSFYSTKEVLAHGPSPLETNKDGRGSASFVRSSTGSAVTFAKSGPSWDVSHSGFYEQPFNSNSNSIEVKKYVTRSVGTESPLEIARTNKTDLTNKTVPTNMKVPMVGIASVAPEIEPVSSIEAKQTSLVKNETNAENPSELKKALSIEKLKKNNSDLEVFEIHSRSGSSIAADGTVFDKVSNVPKRTSGSTCKMEEVSNEVSLNETSKEQELVEINSKLSLLQSQLKKNHEMRHRLKNLEQAILGCNERKMTKYNNSSSSTQTSSSTHQTSLIQFTRLPSSSLSSISRISGTTSLISRKPKNSKSPRRKDHAVSIKSPCGDHCVPQKPMMMQLIKEELKRSLNNTKLLTP